MYGYACWGGVIGAMRVRWVGCGKAGLGRSEPVNPYAFTGRAM